MCQAFPTQTYHHFTLGHAILVKLFSAFGTENKGGKVTQDNRRGEAGRRCRETSGEHAGKTPALGPLDGAPGQEVPETGQRHGSACAGKVDERLVKPEGGEEVPAVTRPTRTWAGGRTVTGQVHHELPGRAQKPADDKRVP